MRTPTQSIAALFLVSGAAASNASPIGQRLVSGGPAAEQLYQVACRAGAGPWHKGFSQERFALVGSLTSEDGAQYQVALLSTVWGQASHATNRLLLFSAQGRYLGRYSGLSSSQPPALISSSVVRFPAPAEHVSEVRFSGGPPPSILVNGEVLPYEPANPSVKGTSCGKPQAAPYVER
jgi:hypothetical protein